MHTDKLPRGLNLYVCSLEEYLLFPSQLMLTCKGLMMKNKSETEIYRLSKDKVQ